MFTMSKTMEKVFFVLTFIFQGSNYLSAYKYGIMHRLHHAHADTEDDPHSPKYSENLFDMMWKTKVYYTAMADPEKAGVDAKYLKDVPEWHAFDNFANHYLVRITWGVLYTLFYMQFVGDAYYLYALLPVHYLMSPVHGAIINWFAHKYGYTNFKVSDTSVNLMPIDLFMMGEGYHNNHHKWGARANFGVRWHEIDPAYQIMKLMNFVGIIKMKKPGKIQPDSKGNKKHAAA
ncbi:acyl-CoA desaturase [Algivirga pacifica]|uniref:Acyl-CoA desaturase n=2 Tax=Algivirga pacifica TaxID=1162670 RepID=A0ABP9CV69_9BACT